VHTPGANPNLSPAWPSCRSRLGFGGTLPGYGLPVILALPVRLRAAVQLAKPVTGRTQKHSGCQPVVIGTGLDIPACAGDLGEPPVPVHFPGAGHGKRSGPAGQVRGVGLDPAAPDQVLASSAGGLYLLAPGSAAGGGVTGAAVGVGASP
jgi:hypothetical protein